MPCRVSLRGKLSLEMCNPRKYHIKNFPHCYLTPIWWHKKIILLVALWQFPWLSNAIPLNVVSENNHHMQYTRLSSVPSCSGWVDFEVRHAAVSPDLCDGQMINLLHKPADLISNIQERERGRNYVSSTENTPYMLIRYWNTSLCMTFSLFFKWIFLNLGKC